MTKDFLSETMEVRESVTYFKCWKKITVSSEFFLCMLKLSSRNKGKLSQFQMGEIKRICYKQNYHKIMTKRSFLNRRDWYKKVPWNFRKEDDGKHKNMSQYNWYSFSWVFQIIFGASQCLMWLSVHLEEIFKTITLWIGESKGTEKEDFYILLVLIR